CIFNCLDHGKVTLRQIRQLKRRVQVCDFNSLEAPPRLQLLRYFRRKRALLQEYPGEQFLFRGTGDPSVLESFFGKSTNAGAAHGSAGRQSRERFNPHRNIGPKGLSNLLLRNTARQHGTDRLGVERRQRVENRLYLVLQTPIGVQVDQRTTQDREPELCLNTV